MNKLRIFPEAAWNLNRDIGNGLLQLRESYRLSITSRSGTQSVERISSHTSQGLTEKGAAEEIQQSSHTSQVTISMWINILVTTGTPSRIAVHAHIPEQDPGGGLEVRPSMRRMQYLSAEEFPLVRQE